ncbi:hypothetical protein LX36DRAFT_161355 [Colletotrichum falcatum]|nr:hypothetical protein LX36DRAFT_161355 [Colletotrichum falcatum]
MLIIMTAVSGDVGGYHSWLARFEISTPARILRRSVGRAPSSQIRSAAREVDAIHCYVNMPGSAWPGRSRQAAIPSTPGEKRVDCLHARVRVCMLLKHGVAATAVAARSRITKEPLRPRLSRRQASRCPPGKQQVSRDGSCAPRPQQAGRHMLV